MEVFLHTIKRLVDDFMAKGMELPTKLVIAWVLNNLTSKYESYVANTIQTICLNEASVSIETIFSSLLDESRRLEGMESTQTLLARQKLANKANPASSKSKAGSKKQKCKFCNKPNHTEATCWQKDPSKKPKKASGKTGANTTISNPDDDEEMQLFSAIAMHRVHTQDWILDSGATTHICCNRELFTSIAASSVSIQWGASAKIYASGTGNITISLANGTKAQLQNVLLVPELGVKLVALNQLIQKGLGVTFSSKGGEITLTNDYKMHAKLQKGLYFLPFQCQKTSQQTSQALLSETTVYNTVSNLDLRI